MKRKNRVNHANIALPLEQCLAKTFDDEQQGRKIIEHCQIVGEVAKELMNRMPPWLRDDLFHEGSELIASAHDLGKVSPTFQEKIYRGTQGYQNNSKPELKTADPEIEKIWGGHAGVSQATAEHLKLGKYIPKILGQHHGYSPTLTNLATDAVFGGVSWQQQREALVKELKSRLKTEFPEVKSDTQARVLAGLTTVADWIGSSSHFDDPKEDWRPIIKQALDEAGFVKPQLKPDLSFSQIFGFQPRKIQQTLIENAKTPGVYVLEAPMGIGKTEAALYSAYKLLSYGKANGIYFALPTQLTSDKIHQRMNHFLEAVLVPESPHREALLVHSNAWLKRIMAVEANPDGSWFQGGKRGILAPFAVGTIDQALMAVMSVKHGFVRTFGLAGKVVILDEVHSYDAYTGTLLDELVKELRKLHCTVIILTATLTMERRQKLTAQQAKKQHYPLISVSQNDGDLQELAVTIAENNHVTIACCQQQALAMDEALKRAEEGQQVLWIENTVADAQAIYQQLSAIDINVEYGLLHSRFLKYDRANNEAKWVALYGKDNPQPRQKTGRILVGTQVLEQSLDIDADFLVARFCPTDMLLQRIGRLWRHKDSVRPVNAQREAWLLAPELQTAIKEAKTAFAKTAKVYSPYVLCRSLAVWSKLKCIELPKDIRPLIEATYQAQKEAGVMLEYQQELEKKRKTLQRLALVGLSKGGQTLPENVSTRYSEQDSVQVLLIKAYRHHPDKQATEITLLNGYKYLLPKNLKFYDKPQWRELAALLIQNTVSVADYLAPEKLAIKDLEWLRNYFYLGNPEFGESLLRVAVVNEADEIKRLMGGNALAGYTLSYDSSCGYKAIKNKETKND
ncbi:CRISPR-associated helicase Cas3 [methanotrophic bacterial endosymbiont of Bathymodiolus sp.]|nr:CRISPR-associated helicase Cas3 [methanotrophic bacterial endosymbiont of Bathymodiolus sp.]